MPDETAATAALLDVVRRDPRCLGYDRLRWTLALVGQTCPWLADLAVVLKRARDHVHSPDPASAAVRHHLREAAPALPRSTRLS